MQHLRGTGSTFSTSDKAWLPFRDNPKIRKRNGRLRRLMRAGELQRMTKAQLRELGEAAIRQRAR